MYRPPFTCIFAKFSGHFYQQILLFKRCEWNKDYAVYIQVGSSLSSFYVGQSAAHKQLRRLEYIFTLCLRSKWLLVVFQYKELPSLLIVVKNCRNLALLSHWSSEELIIFTVDFVKEYYTQSAVQTMRPIKLNWANDIRHSFVFPDALTKLLLFTGTEVMINEFCLLVNERCHTILKANCRKPAINNSANRLW